MDQNGGSSPQQSATAQLKTAQTLTMVALVCGPVSLIIGGMLLSTVAVVCSIIALVKISHARKDTSVSANLVTRVQRMGIIAIAISGIALILNVISFMLVMPILMNYMETGDLDSLYGFTQNPSGSTNQPSSVWG